MASKTSVSGNRVSVDDAAYVVKVMGGGKQLVFDDFGCEVGRFTVTGRAFEAEDYGVEGIHSIALIAKVWVAANTATESTTSSPSSKMICRTVTCAANEPAELAKARAYQAWLKKQIGVKAAFFAFDEAAGKALAVSVWASRQQLEALTRQPPTDAPTAPRAVAVEIVPLTDDL